MKFNSVYNKFGYVREFLLKVDGRQNLIFAGRARKSLPIIEP